MDQLSVTPYKGPTRELKTLVGNAWSYKEYTDHTPTRHHAIALDARACLAYSNRGLAVYDGTRLIGVLLYYYPTFFSKLRRPAHNILMLRHALYLLVRSRESRRLLKSLLRLEKVYDAAMKQAKLNTKNQVVLFVTHGEYQGKGIGKQLMNAYETFCREHDVPEYFLLTDTSCNYGYYNHNGYNRKAKEEATLLTKDGESRRMVYLYNKEA